MREQDIFEELESAYQVAIANQDAETIQAILNNPVVESLKASPEYYMKGLMLRASGFTLFGELDLASDEYALGYEFLDEDADTAEFLVDWALIFLAELSINRGEEYRVDAMSKGVLLLEKARWELDDEDVFGQLTIANLKAFMLMQKGDVSASLEVFEDVSFEPIPIPRVNDAADLVDFFSHIHKGLAVAIEAKDVNLLLNMIQCLSIDDESLSEDQTLFKLFNTTIGFLFELRNEFTDEFNTLFRLKDNLRDAMPNYAHFMDLIGEQDFDALTLFFASFHKDEL